ncbi:MAG: flagellar biosynthesis protein FliQ [bacterium]
MSLDIVISLISEAFYVVLIVLLPVLGVSLVFGILISIFQAATSIQEMTLTFVPKIVLTAIAIVVTLPFMADRVISFTYKIFNMMETIVK